MEQIEEESELNASNMISPPVKRPSKLDRVNIPPFLNVEVLSANLRKKNSDKLNNEEAKQFE